MINGLKPFSYSGRFITFEGIDGAGKSTHIQFVTDLLREKGYQLVVTREPGGTALGEKLRDLLLHDKMNLETEALLMFAARREHIAEVIEPALKRGDWVISDRFTDASFAYQGGGRGLDLDKMRHSLIKTALKTYTATPTEADYEFLAQETNKSLDWVREQVAAIVPTL